MIREHVEFEIDRNEVYCAKKDAARLLWLDYSTFGFITEQEWEKVEP